MGMEKLEKRVVALVTTDEDGNPFKRAEVVEARFLPWWSHDETWLRLNLEDGRTFGIVFRDVDDPITL